MVMLTKGFTLRGKSSMASFAEHVRKIVAGIPRGQVRTYQGVARLAGSPGAARAVGTVMKNNYDESIPCHRVICSDGSVGEYNRGAILKRKKLEKEGILFEKNKILQ